MIEKVGGETIWKGEAVILSFLRKRTPMFSDVISVLSREMDAHVIFSRSSLVISSAALM